MLPTVSSILRTAGIYSCTAVSAMQPQSNSSRMCCQSVAIRIHHVSCVESTAQREWTSAVQQQSRDVNRPRLLLYSSSTACTSRGKKSPSHSAGGTIIEVLARALVLCCRPCAAPALALALPCREQGRGATKKACVATAAAPSTTKHPRHADLAVNEPEAMVTLPQTGNQSPRLLHQMYDPLLPLAGPAWPAVPCVCV